MRTCSRPVASCGGASCTGPTRESRSTCCPRHGGYAAWSSWAPWTYSGSNTCNAGAFRSRTRVCSQPSPSCGGNPCSGMSRDQQLRPPSGFCCSEQYYVVGDNTCRPCTSPCLPGFTEIAPCRGSFGSTSPSNRVCRDTTPPVLTLIGPITITVEGGGSWNEPGVTASDTAAPFNLTSQVVRTGPNMMSMTSQIVRYQIIDSNGLRTLRTRTVTVADRTPPVITLIGSPVVDHEACCNTAGEPLCTRSCAYNDLGARAWDAVSGSVAVVTSGTQFDLGTPGRIVVIHYTATDAHSNTATARRTVRIVDTTQPIISPSNPLYAVFEATNGSTYTDPGATCGDIVDGDLTANMVITRTPGPVQINVPGTYLYTYSCRDGRSPPNVATNVTRRIIVRDSTPPSLQVYGARTLTWEGGRAWDDPGFSATDTLNGDISWRVQVSPGPVRVDLPANTQVIYTYSVRDAAGNAGRSAVPPTRTITIVDTTPPVIRIPNQDVIRHEVCHDLVSNCSAIAYYSATDNLPPYNLTSQVTIYAFLSLRQLSCPDQQTIAGSSDYERDSQLLRANRHSISCDIPRGRYGWSCIGHGRSTD